MESAPAATTEIHNVCSFIDPQTGMECTYDAGEYEFCKKHNYIVKSKNLCRNCFKPKPEGYTYKECFECHKQRMMMTRQNPCKFVNPETGEACFRDAGDFNFCKQCNYFIRENGLCTQCFTKKPDNDKRGMCKRCFIASRKAEKQAMIDRGVCVNYPRCNKTLNKYDLEYSDSGRCRYCQYDFRREMYHELIPFTTTPELEEVQPEVQKEITFADLPALSQPVTEKHKKSKKKSSKAKMPGVSVTPNTFWADVPEKMK